MIDPIAAGVVVGIGWAGRKILGPTADHYGNELKTYITSGQASQNVNNILDKAGKKLGSAIEEVGEVPARVLKDLIFEGSFCEDDVEAEYRAGIIASSRSTSTNSDSEPFLSLVNRLSSLELRLHFILYSALKLSVFDSEISPLKEPDLRKIRIFLDLEIFTRTFKETNRSLNRLHILSNEGLIASRWASGDAEHMSKHTRCKLENGGVLFSPTPLGCLLFLYANGQGQLPPTKFFNNCWSVHPIEGIEIQAEEIRNLDTDKL